MSSVKALQKKEAGQETWTKSSLPRYLENLFITFAKSSDGGKVVTGHKIPSGEWKVSYWKDRYMWRLWIY